MRSKTVFIPVTAILLSLQSFSQVSLRQAGWQQKVNYTINVKLDDVNHRLEGFESLEYFNNSPNSLDTIYYHIWPNAYRNNQTAFAKQHLSNGQTDFQYATEDQRGEINNLNFKVDGQTVKWQYDSRDIDICYLILNTPVKPGTSVTITTPFNVKLPKTFSRMGHIGQEYQITQWFPKPAVYDVNGWHPMPYLDLGEFYYEYGKFDVSITVPENYIVAATGELQNEDEMDWLNSKANDFKFVYPDSVPSSKELKTLRYLQDNVHDFAWFASKKFYVYKDQVELPSGKVVSTWLFDPLRREYLVNPIGIVSPIKDAITNYSAYVGEYPYSHATVVVGPLEAGGGMEYPMITIVANPGQQVIVHEVGHNWFQGILGSNERDYPWMDEGINNFYETLFDFDSSDVQMWNSWDRDQPYAVNLRGTFFQFKLAYEFAKSRGESQPSGIHSEEYTSLNYGLMVYGKNTLLFTYLRDYLGAETFDNCMRTYFDRWKFKHPLPGDIQAVFEEVSGKKLNWFFVDLLTTDASIDYSIHSAEMNNGVWEIKLEQKGTAQVPVPVDCYKNGKVVNTIWVERDTNIATVKDNEYTHFSVSLKPYFLDVNGQNNTIKTHGILKKTEPISIDFGGNALLQDPRRTQLRGMILPAWNEYNQFMLGATIFNAIEPNRTVQYRVTPLYSFSEGSLNGYARIQFNDVKERGALQRIESGLAASSFQYNPLAVATQYTKLSVFATLHFRKSSPRSTITNKVYEYFHYIQNEDVESGNVAEGKPKFLDLSFEHKDNRKINPWSYKLRLHENLDSTSGAFRKLTAEFKYSFNYSPVNYKRKLNLRLFAGTFLKPLETLNGIYALRMGGNDGRMDYMFNNVLMGRSAPSNNVFGQQLIDREGNLKTVAQGLISNESLLAMNIDWAFAGPLRFFFDAAYISDYEKITVNTEAAQYVGGISLVIAEDIFRINFPIFQSDAIQEYYDNNIDTYGQRITFTLNLNKLNPFRIADNFVY